MDIQTQTSVTVSFSLSEAEARQILVDPRAFQKTLRAALAGAHENGRARRGATTIRRRGRAPKGGTEQSPLVGGTKRCPKCGEAQVAAKFARHVSHCRGGLSTALAAE